MGGILPRAEKQSTGLFFTADAAALFESLPLNTVPKKEKNAKMRSPLFWRSGRDSNPRTAFDRHTISSRARYDRFDTTPYVLVRGGAPAPRFGQIVVGRSSFDIIQYGGVFVNSFFRDLNAFFFVRFADGSYPRSRVSTGMVETTGFSSGVGSSVKELSAKKLTTRTSAASREIRIIRATFVRFRV